jgi:transcriptional regulator with XRE-family HTH domain
MLKQRRKFNVQPLIEARRQKRWTREEVAVRINRSSQTVYQVESGRSENERTVMAMSEVLDVPMEALRLEAGSN